MIAAIDLFCGIGGLTHGLAKRGVRVVAGFDIDPECRFPYEANNDVTFVEGDVSKLSATEIAGLWPKGAYRLLAGCAPCQPFSTYSRSARQTQTDSKWQLLNSFGRLVRECQPDLVTMENVPQLADHPVFKDFLGNLSGYYCWHEVVQCSRFGVPQTRKRLVLLASKLGPISLVSPASQPKTVRDTISKLKALAAGETDPSDPLHSACSLSALNLERIKQSKPGGTWRDWHLDLVAKCHLRKGGETYPSVYGRMEWDAFAPTITTQSFGYGNGRFGHPQQDRAITLREAALLQTFPSSYAVLKSGEKARFSVLGRLIGNAVPVRIGEIVGESFNEHLSSQRKS